MSDAVQTTVEGGVGIIRLCRPERRNALDTAASAALDQAFARLGADMECRVILLTGGNEAFCSGWDTREFAGLAALPDDQLTAAFAANFTMLNRLSACPQPTIAAIAGPAMGFGFSLAVRCDIGLASPTARFALPELAYGLVPGMVMQDAVDTMGRRAALDWMLSAETFDVAAGRRHGIVTRVAASDDVVAHGLALARRIAGFASMPARRTKEMARQMERGEVTPEQAIAESIRHLRKS